MEAEADTPLPGLTLDGSLRTPRLAIHSVACRAHACGCGGEEPVDSPRIILPRRGVFIYHLHHTAFVADANSAFLLDVHDVCRVSHPIEGGDDCTVLIPDPALLEEAFGEGRWLGSSGAMPRFRTKRIGSSPEIQLALWTLQTGLGDPEESLFAEETALLVLEKIARMSPDGLADRPPWRSPQRGYVERTRALLADSVGAPLTLDAIGRAVHCSPFHLARLFRQSTGSSIHQYLTSLRMNQALQRLAGGEGDLSRLALDLGFSSHSHFSARFRRIFGMPPQDARSLLARKRLAEMRRILTALPPSSGLRS